MALTLNIGKCTLLGNYRENNEDAIDVKQFADLTICLVADGMGGHQAGEVASGLVVDHIVDWFTHGAPPATSDWPTVLT